MAYALRVNANEDGDWSTVAVSAEGGEKQSEDAVRDKAQKSRLRAFVALVGFAAYTLVVLPSPVSPQKRRVEDSRSDMFEPRHHYNLHHASRVH